MITLGVDIDSRTGKALVLSDRDILAWEIVPTRPDSVETARLVTGRALEKADRSLEEMSYVVSTGYGRVVVPFAHKNISEISCHAKGATWLHPSVRSILDMGGQTARPSAARRAARSRTS